MLFHYLRIAWRSFRRHTGYNLINIGCLAIGLAAVLIILVYVLHEHSYDKWHANSGRIFSVNTRSDFGSNSWDESALSFPVGPAGLQADPDVKSMVRASINYSESEIQNPALPAAQFPERSNLIFADSNFFRFFSFRLLRGSPDDVLTRPFSVVLTRSTAKKYFGTADPLGKVLLLDKKYSLQVTGVTADVPSNSSIHFDMVAPLATMERIDDYRDDVKVRQLQSGSFFTWFLVRPGGDTARIGRNLTRIARAAVGKLPNSSGDAGFVQSHRFNLLPIAATHFKHPDFGSIQYLGVFTWVAVLILLLAIVNYMSLATARSAMRAREVGIRKAIGAGRGKIAGQFYVESAINAVLAFALGLGLFLLIKPGFCHLMELPIDMGFLITPAMLGAFVLLLLGVIGVSGSYPSILLSSFRPVAVLYGKMSRQRGSERIRKGFLIFQFTLSMALMTCAFVIGKQLYYIRHADVGVARENIVMIPFAETMGHYAAFQADVSRIPGIRRIATTRSSLYYGIEYLTIATLPGQSEKHDLPYIQVDSNFIPLLGLKWKERPVGANGYGPDHMVLNETAVKSFKWTGRATGEHFNLLKQPVTVAGVLADFNVESLHNKIGPFGMYIERSLDSFWKGGKDGMLYAKIEPHINVPTLLETIHRIYSRYDNQTPFQYTFLDDDFNKLYRTEDRLEELMNSFTAVTMVIACLGLFALATFAAQQRLKEIGIRKVLGASVASISALLSRDFLWPILLSVVIASPVAWWVMHKWLENFAFRTPISWWVFPAVGGGLLLIAQLTVLFRTIRAARTNPTVNLRSE